MNRSILRIQVFDLQRVPITRASVTVGGASNVQQTSPGNFVVYGLANKTIEVVVEAEGLKLSNGKFQSDLGKTLSFLFSLKKVYPLTVKAMSESLSIP